MSRSLINFQPDDIPCCASANQRDSIATSQLQRTGLNQRSIYENAVGGRSHHIPATALTCISDSKGSGRLLTRFRTLSVHLNAGAVPISATPLTSSLLSRGVTGRKG